MNVHDICRACDIADTMHYLYLRNSYRYSWGVMWLKWGKTICHGKPSKSVYIPSFIHMIFFFLLFHFTHPSYHIADAHDIQHIELISVSHFSLSVLYWFPVHQSTGHPMWWPSNHEITNLIVIIIEVTESNKIDRHTHTHIQYKFLWFAFGNDDTLMN